jgi:RimJ/RimL family protein N-acetyltransferase
MRAPEVLDGPHVRLRRWDAGDAQAVEAMCSDPIVSRWSRLPEEDAAAWIARQRDRADGVSLAVTEPPGAAAVGKVALGHHDPEARLAELSFWVVPAARGRGVAVAACRALCGWGFARLGLRAVLLDIDVDNEASRGVARRLGASPPPDPFHIEIDRSGIPRRLITYLLPAEACARPGSE